MTIFRSPAPAGRNTIDDQLGASKRLHGGQVWLRAAAGVSAPEVP